MNWDLYSKSLLKECPQDFVTYLMPGARYICTQDGQLQTRAGKFKKREMRADVMLKAKYNGQFFLIDVEFQTKKDPKIDERLLGYSYEGTRQHKLEVLSCVIYLTKVSEVPQPPLDRILPDNSRSILFEYRSIELAQMRVEDLRKHNLDALHPLMLLCEDGATYEVLEEVLERLEKKNYPELLAATKFFAGMVLPSEEDQAYLERRFTVIDEFLMEHSWTYRQTVEKGLAQGRTQGRAEGRTQGHAEGRAEGRAEGLAKGLAQGRIEGLRENIEAVVQVRFPTLLALTKSRTEHLTDLAKLEQLSLTVSTARSSREVKKFLLALK